ncbi:MAG TPA: hypothetical protein VGS21_08285, partial [Acidimicrobiales bacterium]|nr:hypothetical protein [Acidimicrobiales bacterium]
MYETLAEVLSERLTTREARPEDVRLANELRAELDRAATEMIAAIAPPPGAPALRLTKGIVSALVACERFASETLGLPDETATMNIAIGNLLGSLVTFHVLGETPADMVTPESTLQHGMDLVRAGQPTDPILELVESLAPEKRKALAGELSGRYSALISGWPRFDPDWWPRVEETARVRLADDAVLLSGRFDVLVGGPPSRYPL